MKRSGIYRMAAAAISRVDKEKATESVAAVAAAVANGEGHPGLRRVASLVANNIQARTEEARAGQVTEGQWQQIAEAMQSVRSSDRAGAANAARRSSIGTGSSFSPPGSASRAQRGRPVARATLAGDYDAANIGGFTFGLFRSQRNAQLTVGQLGVPGHVGGLFSLESLPRSTWIRLQDRLSRPLPVWILVEGPTVELMVGSGPENVPVLRPVDTKVSL